MIRRLFAILSVKSLLICMATCALWVRSTRTVDAIPLGSAGEQRELRSWSGWLILHNVPAIGWNGQKRAEYLQAYTFWYSKMRHLRAAHDVGDDFISWDDLPPDLKARLPAAPVEPPAMPALNVRRVHYALPAGIAAVLPILWLIQRLMRRRVMPGHCPACGYDLRATPGRCPECGATPAAGASA